jgi:DNA-binding response OmpR family regulator
MDELHDPSEWASGHFLSYRHHILLAEDDGDMRRMLAAELRRDGYTVTELSDGTALLQHMRSLTQGDAGCPNLLISDVRMPGVSGLQVLHELQVTHPALPVLIITAFGDDRTHVLASSFGAETILDKPFSFAELRAAVYCALEPLDRGRDNRPFDSETGP